MAPGYRHKGVCRAGLLADDEGGIEDSTNHILYDKDDYNSSDMTRKVKRVRTLKPGEYPSSERTSNGAQGFSYDVNFLAMYLDEKRDHYNSPWSSGNCIGQREMREWLLKLWVGKPGMRDLMWKGACLALNASKWSESLAKIYAELRDTVSREDELNLASFLGEQLRNLHLLPHPPLNISTFSDIEQGSDFPFTNGSMEAVPHKSNIPAEWDIFIRTLFKKKKDVSSRLIKWGDPIPSTLIEKVDKYIPDDFAKFLYMFKDENGVSKVGKSCSWIHSDIMDDNIHMELCGFNSCFIGNAKDTCLVNNGSLNVDGDHAERKTWCPSHILDFSNLSIGDPIYDLIPLYLDIFRGDCYLLKQFLDSYKLPLVRQASPHEDMEGGDKFG
ncbi:hypothetical protein RchiOBHm_Chr7g0243001 [Rosa chinensis]|uniref:Uncharacterized protein n=1 Tax=Rosa chinensis TaxID=74649 RepID=A0A2P6PIN2_ROSCH|nr:hypothetical protein RchiOBHm_Chr7g0243001 [Rosa chinensis]